jgi:hypothetical protein
MYVACLDISETACMLRAEIGPRLVLVTEVTARQNKTRKRAILVRKVNP